MAIFKMVGDKERLEKIEPTSFGQEAVLERADLQRILRDQPDVLEDGLLIISEEFGNWEDSNRRIDLLGLDVRGRLTVIELKRGDTGAHMDLQAIRYAAMVANMTYKQVVDNFQIYLEKRANEEDKSLEEDDAETRIRDHLATTDQEGESIQTEIPRIILASEDFGKELTTCVMWLNDSWLRNAGQEIKCVQLQPHRNGNEILVETSVVIPLPEASAYQTQLGEREQETRVQRPGKVKFTDGSHDFKESIDRASENFRGGLQQLFNCAIDLEKESLVKLSCRIQSGNADIVNLFLGLPNQDLWLVSFTNLLRYKGEEKGGEISIRPNESGLVLDSYNRFNDLVDPIKSKSGWRYRRLSRLIAKGVNIEEVLQVVREVYREAAQQDPSNPHSK